MNEYIANVRGPKGGTSMVTIRAWSPKDAEDRLLRLGYVAIWDITRN